MARHGEGVLVRALDRNLGSGGVQGDWGRVQGSKLRWMECS